MMSWLERLLKHRETFIAASRTPQEPQAKNAAINLADIARLLAALKEGQQMCARINFLLKQAGNNPGQIKLPIRNDKEVVVCELTNPSLTFVSTREIEEGLKRLISAAERGLQEVLLNSYYASGGQ